MSTCDTNTDLDWDSIRAELALCHVLIDSVVARQRGLTEHEVLVLRNIARLAANRRVKKKGQDEPDTGD